MLTSHLSLCLPTGLFLSGFSQQNFAYISLLNVLHALPISSSLFISF
jgi:hypothetical protein